MNQRKDSYRAALGRERDRQGARTPHATTVSSRWVRVTIEVDPDVRRTVARWVMPPVGLAVGAGAAALRALTALTARAK